MFVSVTKSVRITHNNTPALYFDFIGSGVLMSGGVVEKDSPKLAGRKLTSLG